MKRCPFLMDVALDEIQVGCFLKSNQQFDSMIILLIWTKTSFFEETRL